MSTKNLSHDLHILMKRGCLCNRTRYEILWDANDSTYSIIRIDIRNDDIIERHTSIRCKDIVDVLSKLNKFGHGKWWQCRVYIVNNNVQDVQEFRTYHHYTGQKLFKTKQNVILHGGVTDDFMETALKTIRYGRPYVGFVKNPVVWFQRRDYPFDMRVGIVPEGAIVRPFHRSSIDHVEASEDESIVVPIAIAKELCLQFILYNNIRMLNGHDYYLHNGNCYKNWESNGKGNCGGNHWPETNERITKEIHRLFVK